MPTWLLATLFIAGCVIMIGLYIADEIKNPQ